MGSPVPPLQINPRFLCQAVYFLVGNVLSLLAENMLASQRLIWPLMIFMMKIAHVVVDPERILCGMRMPSSEINQLTTR